MTLALTFHRDVVFFIPTIAYVYTDEGVNSIQLSFALFSLMLNFGGANGV